MAKDSIIDPTANVIALVAANDRRQDDLRKADASVMQAKLDSIREIHKAEQDKFLAIREIDNANVNALATRSAIEWENARKAIQDTALTLAKATAEQNATLSSRIAALEKEAYTGAGKQQVVDPQMEQLLRKMSESAGMSKLWGWIIAALAAGVSIATYLHNVR